MDAVTRTVPVRGRKVRRMRLIDADALIAQMEADAEHMEEPIGQMFTYAAISDIKHAPTVVELVRCKDCKHFELDKPYIIQGIPVLGHECCNAWGDGCKTDPDGYCFLAERREE